MTPEATPPPAAPATTASVDNSNPMQAPPAAPPTAEKAPQSDLSAAKPSRSHAKKVTAQNDAMSAMPADNTAPPPGDSGTAASAATGSANLDEMEHEIDQLSNRAAAVNSGLDRLQQEQSAAGYGLRGDMVERQASMKASLFKAEEAIQHGDAARAEALRGANGERYQRAGEIFGALKVRVILSAASAFACERRSGVEGSLQIAMTIVFDWLF